MQFSRLGQRLILQEYVHLSQALAPPRGIGGLRSIEKALQDLIEPVHRIAIIRVQFKGSVIHHQRRVGVIETHRLDGFFQRAAHLRAGFGGQFLKRNLRLGRAEKSRPDAHCGDQRQRRGDGGHGGLAAAAKTLHEAGAVLRPVIAGVLQAGADGAPLAPAAYQRGSADADGSGGIAGVQRRVDGNDGIAGVDKRVFAGGQLDGDDAQRENIVGRLRR